MEHVEFATSRLSIRTPLPGDGAGYAKYYQENNEFLQPWSPIFSPEMFSAREWEDSIPYIHQQFRQGTSVRLGLYHGQELIGVANITDIKASPLFSGILGYTLSQEHQGQGLMREALQAVIEYLFSERGLHRISANYMPRNERSGKLLRSLGFFVEGYARDYLLINGQWEDHILAALINSNWEHPTLRKG